MKKFITAIALLSSMSSFAAEKFEFSAQCLSADERLKVEVFIGLEKDQAGEYYGDISQGARINMMTPDGDIVEGKINSFSQKGSVTRFVLVSKTGVTLVGKETPDKVSYTVTENGKKTSLVCSNSPLVLLNG
jgi:hypothetical protein